MARLIIRGLVRIARQVEKEIAAGTSRVEIQRQAAQAVGQVEQICRKHGITPHDLPAPSRRAYQRLSQLRSTRAQTSTVPQVTRKNPGRSSLIQACAGFHQELYKLAQERINSPTQNAIAGLDPALEDLLGQIREQARAVEARCARQGSQPTRLPAPSRRAYQWLRFLSDTEILAGHVRTLSRLVEAGRRVQTQQKTGLQVEFYVSLNFQASLYRARHVPEGTDLQVHEGFLDAPLEVLDALAATALSRRSAKRTRAIRDYADSDAFAEIALALDADDPTAEQSSARGQCYNLKDLFEEVNQAYFAGQLAAPRLRWTRSLTRRVFGHYQPATDTVTISQTLDTQSIPECVVRFVMYHELLHKFLGLKKVNGRRYAHTAEFRTLERQFAGYEEAQAWLRRPEKISS